LQQAYAGFGKKWSCGIKIPAFFAKTNSVFVKGFPLSGIYSEKMQMHPIYQLGTGFS
jgi:hypothetical protein